MSGDTRRRPAARDLHRYRGLPTRLLALAAVFATPLSLQPTPSDAARMAQIVRDAGRSLAAGNAASFLFYFDRERFADYSALESDVDALTRHSEIASSTEVTKVEAEGEAYLVEVDWILRLRPISAFGGIDTRRELLKLRFERVKDRWKIVKLQPIEFFRPPGLSPHPPRAMVGKAGYRLLVLGPISSRSFIGGNYWTAPSRSRLGTLGARV